VDGQVYINRGEARPGALVTVEVEQAADYDLVGGIADGSTAVMPRKPARSRLRVVA
jgi:TRAM domain